MPSSSVITQRPTATIGSLATTLFTVLSLLVAHGVIPASFAKAYGPYIVAAIIAVTFLLVWLNVSPAKKLEQLVVDHQAEIQTYADQLDNGRLPEADIARLRGEFEDAAVSLLNVLHPAAAELTAADAQLTGDAHPDAEAIGAPDAATMSAGAPTPAPLVTGALAPSQG